MWPVVDGATDAPLLTSVTAAFVPLPQHRSEFQIGSARCAPARELALMDEVRSELLGGLELLTLTQRVRRAGTGLELRGFPQQTRDALHLHFDCSAGDAPLVSAAHGAIRPCRREEGDATRDALLIRFVRAAFVLLPRQWCLFYSCLGHMVAGAIAIAGALLGAMSRSRRR
jgi:hypothetical protein